jgi:hypothetical protein
LRNITKHKYEIEFTTFSEKMIHYVRIYNNEINTLVEVSEYFKPDKFKVDSVTSPSQK